MTGRALGGNAHGANTSLRPPSNQKPKAEPKQRRLVEAVIYYLFSFLCEEGKNQKPDCLGPALGGKLPAYHGPLLPAALCLPICLADPQLRHHLLHVRPHVLLRRRRAAEIRRLIGGLELPALVLQPVPAHRRDAVDLPREPRQGNAPERDDDAWLDQLDLPADIRAAGIELVGLGIAVLRRPALDDIGDVDLLA